MVHLLEKSTSNAGAHKAGDGTPNKGFYAKFCKVSSLVGCQLAYTAYLDADRSKIGKAAKGISGY